MADELNRTQQLLSHGIRSVDLRLAGRVIGRSGGTRRPSDAKAGKKKTVAGTN